MTKDPYYKHLRVKARPGPMEPGFKIKIKRVNPAWSAWRWECTTCRVHARGRYWYVGGTCDSNVRWRQDRIIHNGLEYQRGYYEVVESGFTRALRGAERHIRKYHTEPYGEKKMKEVFLWVLVGYMVLDFIVMAARWITGHTDKITCGVLILVSITHGFFVIGGLLVLNGVWT